MNRGEGPHGVGGVSIKRVLAREEGRVVRDLLGRPGNGVTILSPEGEVILGEGSGKGINRVPVIVEGEILVWVSGNGSLDAVASLVLLLARREQERRERAAVSMQERSPVVSSLSA